MATALDTKRLGAVFQSRPDIIDGIKRAAGKLLPLCDRPIRSFVLG